MRIAVAISMSQRSTPFEQSHSLVVYDVAQDHQRVLKSQRLLTPRRMSRFRGVRPRPLPACM